MWKTYAGIVCDKYDIFFIVDGTVLIIFILQKLTGVISWSWLWVLVPLWAPIILFAGAFLFIHIVLLLGKLQNLFKEVIKT